MIGKEMIKLERISWLWSVIVMFVGVRNVEVCNIAVVGIEVTVNSITRRHIKTTNVNSLCIFVRRFALDTAKNEIELAVDRIRMENSKIIFKECALYIQSQIFQKSIVFLAIIHKVRTQKKTIRRTPPSLLYEKRMKKIYGAPRLMSDSSSHSTRVRNLWTTP